MEEKNRDLESLENFDADEDLARLEAMLDRFNIFEAVGITWQEKFHSEFLAFLLDPNERHGMGDAFVKWFLQRAVTDAPNIPVPVTPVELNSRDFEGMEVRREWRWIDIFLLDEKNRLAIIIENKIWSGEHSDQLARYYEAVREEYPDHKILALYLTPHGNEPSHSSYLPVDYRAVCEILDELVESRAVTEPDARTLIKHYTEMLRRHIVGDHEIERLSREIYAKHSRAIDLIYQHRPDPVGETRNLIENLVRGSDQFVYKGKSRVCVWFNRSGWEVPTVNAAYNRLNEVLGFVFHNSSDRLTLYLESNPNGDQETRKKLHDMSLKDRSLFQNPESPEDSKWPKFYSRVFLTPEFYETATDTEREAEIHKNWDDFLENDLPRIDAALKKEAWIWEPEGAETSS